MYDIQMVVPLKQQDMARNGIVPSEWDVLAVDKGSTLLGVVETFDAGYMFTDTFGHQTEYMDGEHLREVFDDIVIKIQSQTIN